MRIVSFVCILVLLDVALVSGMDWYYWNELPPSATTDSSARAGHAMVATDNEVMLTGGEFYDLGNTNDIFMENDVWMISYGGSWTFQTSAVWAGRAYHAMDFSSTYQTMMMTGGIHNDNTAYNDVWATTDLGVTWTYITSGPFSGRSDAAMRFLGTNVYLVGGYIPSSTYLKEVWSATHTGVTWSLLTAPVFGARSDLLNAVVGNYLFVAGGSTSLVSFHNDVWKTSDGTTWTQVTADAEWDNAFGLYHMTVVKNKLVVVSGSTATAGGTDSNNTWISTDGASWSLQTSSSFLSRVWGAVCTLPDSNSLVMGGGYHGGLGSNGYLDDVWTTPVSNSAVWGDPHFIGFKGQQYDVAGLPGKILNWYSDVDIQINARIFMAVNSTQATYIGSVFIRLGKYIKLRLQVNPIHRFGAFPHNVRRDPVLGRIVQLDDCGYAGWVDQDKLFVQWQQYRILMTRRSKKLKWNPAFDFINIQMTGKPTSMELVHGLWGQSWRMDSHVYSTAKQGEGVIEGTVEDYVVSDLFASDFKFNRYIARPGQLSAEQCHLEHFNTTSLFATSA